MAKVIFVDDNPRSVAPIQSTGLDVEIYAPEEVLAETLQDARVVMVDWNLGRIGDGPMQPIDGFGVAALLGSWAIQHKPDACAAFCMYSGHLENMKGGYPPGLYREHAVARTRGVEWVFERPTSEEKFAAIAEQLKSLLRAVEAVSQLFAQEITRSESILKRILGMKEISEQLLSDIEETRPPTQESMRATNGRSLLRWLLHRILPYPTFLIDEYQLAALCRLSYGEFQEGLKVSKPLQQFRDAARYEGILSEFIGPRWWGNHANQYLWELTEGRPFDPTALRHCFDLQSIGDEEKVLCLDADYRWEDELAPIDEAVRFTPEDWPPFARDAWMRKDRIRDEPQLIDFVNPLDRDVLNA